MNRFFVYTYLFWMIALAGVNASAQNATQTPVPTLPAGITVDAVVQPEEPFVGDQFTYSLRAVGSVVVEEFSLPAFTSVDGIEVLSRAPSEARNMMFDGRSNSSRFEHSLSVTLRALRSGNFTIPNARVKIQGRWYDTGPVALNIRDVVQIEVDDDVFQSIISARTSSQQNNRVLENRYFALAEMPETVYRGQAVPIKIYIYRSPDMPIFLTWEEIRDSAARDFLVPNIGRTNSSMTNPTWERVDFGGQEFLRTHINTTYVIPTRGGEAMLKPPSTRLYLPASSPARRNIPDFDLFRPAVDSIPALAEIRARKVNVLDPPRPPEGVASQLIGDMAVDVSLDRETVPHRDLVTLKVAMVGLGYLDLVSPPTLPEIPGLRLVSQTGRGQSRLNAGLLVSSRDFEFVYQATTPGEVEIPEIAFAVFDPETEEQRVIRSAALKLTIERGLSDSVSIAGADGSQTGGQASRRADAVRLGSDVAYIDTRVLTAASLVGGGPFYLRPWFFLLQLIPFIAAISYGVWAIGSRRERRESYAAIKKRGRRSAEKAIADARAQIESADRETFHATLSRGILEYVGLLHGKTKRSLTAEEAVSILREKGEDRETCDRLEQVLKICDSIRYSPAPDTKQSRQAIIDESQKLLDRLSDSKGGQA